MNLRSLLAAVFVIALSTKCIAQKDKYEPFREYILEHCKVPKSVIGKCGWQVAMVRLRTNVQGKVIPCDLMNKATSDSMAVMFKPLLNYQFPFNLKMQGKSFVFAYAFYNINHGCNPTDSPDPDIVFRTTYQVMIDQIAKHPKTIFYKITFGSEDIDKTTYN